MRPLFSNSDIEQPKSRRPSAVSITRISAKSTSAFLVVTASGNFEYSSFLIDLQHGQEGLLRNLDRAELLHALLAGFLLLEQLALARDVAAVAAWRSRPCDTPSPCCARRSGRRSPPASRPRIAAAESLLCSVSTILRPLRSMPSRCAIIAIASTLSLLIKMSSFTSGPASKRRNVIVERRVAAAHRLQAVEEVEHDLGERQLEFDLHLPPRIHACASARRASRCTAGSRRRGAPAARGCSRG